MSKFTPGPVESLARLAIQSDRYRTDHEFRDAVDAVLGDPLYDAAPDMLEALKALLVCPAIADGGHDDPEWGCQESAAAEAKARAALAKAGGGE